MHHRSAYSERDAAGERRERGRCVILPNWAVPALLKVMRANRAFVTTAGAEQRIAEREIRPRSFAPPRLRPDVRVSVDRRTGWPVYTVAPATATPVGSVVYAHGGGWVNEIAGPHWRLIADIAADARTTVIVPIYPLIPFGTALEVRDGVVELAMQAARDHGSVVLAGDSAGGQIVLSAAFELRDRGVVSPRTIVMSPALDLTWSNPRIPDVQPSDPWLAVPGGKVLAEAWRGDLPLKDPAVSPLFGDFSDLGPLDVYTGVRDVLNPDAHVLVERAAAAGVDVTLHERAGQVHVYPLLPTSIGRDARAEIVARVGEAVRSEEDRVPAE